MAAGPSAGLDGREHMSLDPDVQKRLEGLTASAPVVLFMKGTRDGPQCGFSATVVGILDRILPDYETVDVLIDPEVREGIKALSQWPTIPQLYVRGEFVGGCDIVQEMFEKGELHEALGLSRPDGAAPAITITDGAAALLNEAAQGAPAPDLHLSIDARFHGRMGFGPRQGGEIEVEANGFTLLLDPDTAPRADGITIDVVETPQGKGLTIRNPNAPEA
jgi:monothiol glutaredoxin